MRYPYLQMGPPQQAEDGQGEKSTRSFQVTQSIVFLYELSCLIQ